MIRRLREDYTPVNDSLVESYAEDFSQIVALCHLLSDDCSRIVRWMHREVNEIDTLKADSCITNAVEYLQKAASQVSLAKSAMK